MIVKSEKKNGGKYPCENAFMTNPVASVNDATGYVPTLPDESYEAENYADLCQVPVSSKESLSRIPKAK